MLMRPIVALLLIIVLLFASGCGAVFVSGAAGNVVTTSTGLVSIVRLTVTNDGTQVTFVTLLETVGARDFFFCGNLSNQFPINSTVRVNFMPGTPCNNTVAVVVLF